MGEWLRARSVPPGNHLPPPEVSNLLRTDPKGKTRPLRMIETPLDEFGVPDTDEIIKKLVDTIDMTYKWPHQTNVHHAAWPRRSYETELEREYRNGTSLLLHIPVQFHNLAHSVMKSPPKPEFDVMRQRVMEQRKVDLLFECGRRAVRYARWSDNIEGLLPGEADEAWIENTRGFYGAKARFEADNFFRIVEKLPQSQLGLLPEQNELAEKGIVSATKYLGRYAAAEAMDYRHLVQDASL